LAENPDRKRPLARPMHRLENYINMDREGKGLEGGDWFYLAQREEICAHNDDTSGFFKKCGEFVD
jgi:hypothetical protein